MCVCILLKANTIDRRVRAYALKGKENFTGQGCISCRDNEKGTWIYRKSTSMFITSNYISRYVIKYFL